MANTILNETMAQLDGQAVAVATGMPNAGDFAAFTSGYQIEGLSAANATAALNAFTGDSGSGGVKGLVPAPAAGDAAAGYALLADGSFGVPSGSGLVVQYVKTETGAFTSGTTLMSQSDNIPQNTQGNQFMTLAITPTSATNLLRIDITAFLGVSGTNQWMIGALFQDSTAAALAAGMTWMGGANWMGQLCFTHWMVAGTTSPTTFKFRAGSHSSGTTYFNGTAGSRQLGGVMASTISITEYVV